MMVSPVPVQETPSLDTGICYELDMIAESRLGRMLSQLILSANTRPVAAAAHWWTVPDSPVIPSVLVSEARWSL